MEKYEETLATAYVRGVSKKAPGLLPAALAGKPLGELESEETEAIIRAGEAAGLKI